MAVSLTTWFLCPYTVFFVFSSLSLSAQVIDQNISLASIPTGLALHNSENFSSGGIPKTVYMMVKEIIYVNHVAQSEPSKWPCL